MPSAPENQCIPAKVTIGPGEYLKGPRHIHAVENVHPAADGILFAAFVRDHPFEIMENDRAMHPLTVTIDAVENFDVICGHVTGCKLRGLFPKTGACGTKA